MKCVFLQCICVKQVQETLNLIFPFQMASFINSKKESKLCLSFQVRETFLLILWSESLSKKSLQGMFSYHMNLNLSSIRQIRLSKQTDKFAVLRTNNYKRVISECDYPHSIFAPNFAPNSMVYIHWNMVYQQHKL